VIGRDHSRLCVAEESSAGNEAWGHGHDTALTG
jgi:hypothetical protein